MYSHLALELIRLFVVLAFAAWGAVVLGEWIARVLGITQKD